MLEDEEISLNDIISDAVVVEDSIVDESIDDDTDVSDSVDSGEMTIIEVTRAVELDSLDFEPLDSSFAYSNGVATFNGTYTLGFNNTTSTASGQISIKIKGSNSVIVDADEQNDGIVIKFDQTIINQINANTTQIGQNSTNIGANSLAIGNLEQSIGNMYNRSEINQLIANFVTSATDSLENYYKKSETYTKGEVNNLISGISSLRVQIVETLPETGDTSTIYFVSNGQDVTGANIYNEYMYINNAWELIGNTQIDLSNYCTQEQVNGLLGGKQDTISDLSTIRSGASKGETAVQPTDLNDFTYSVTADGFFRKNEDLTLTATGGYVMDTYKPTGDSRLFFNYFVRPNALDNIVSAHNGLVTNVNTNYVKNTIKVNSKPLSADITLTASDVGASTFSGSYADLENIPDTIVNTDTANNFTTTPQINGVNIATVNDLPVSDITSTQTEITEVD